MSRFTPTIRELDPPYALDRLSSATLTALLRGPRRGSTWGPLRTLVLGLPSLGLIPAILLPRSFAYRSGEERVQLRSFLEWVNRQRALRGEPAVQVETSASPAVRRLCQAAIATAVVALLTLAGAAVFSSTPSEELYVQALGNLWRAPRPVFVTAWMLLMTVSYTFLLLAVWTQAGDTRRLLGRIDAAAGTDLVEQSAASAGTGKAPKRGGWTVRLGWFAVAVLPLALGGWWAIPMAVAAAARFDYLDGPSPRSRRAAARYMRRDLSQAPPARREAVVVPQQVWPSCPNARCGALVPILDLTCPRCGAPAA